MIDVEDRKIKSIKRLMGIPEVKNPAQSIQKSNTRKYA